MTKPAEKKDKDKSKAKDEKAPGKEAGKKAVEAQVRPQDSQGGESPGKEAPSGSAQGEAPPKAGKKKKKSSSKKPKAAKKEEKKEKEAKEAKAGNQDSFSKEEIAKKASPAEAAQGGEPAKPKKPKKPKKAKKSKSSKKAKPAHAGKGKEEGGTGGGEVSGSRENAGGDREKSSGPPGEGGAGSAEKEKEKKKKEKVPSGEAAEQSKPEEPEGFAEGLSKRTLEVLGAARAIKDRLGHGAVTTGHLIAAILEEEAGISRDVFWDINAYPDMFVEEMARIKEIPVPESGYWFDDLVGLVIERARDGAEALGGGPVEPEHLALALLSLAEGPAAEILEEFSMDREDLKAEILAHMGVPVEECPDWEHETKREKNRRIRKQKAKK